MHLIPQSWSHVHLLVSVFPSFGLVFVLGFYFAGLLADNNGIKRTCLVLIFILALLSVPIYLSGDGSMAALSALVVTGIAALVALMLSGRPSDNAHHLVLGLAIITLGLMIAADGWEL